MAIRPEKIRLRPLGMEWTDGCVRGRVEEVVYIGTDTYYLVRLTERCTVRVRVQNSQNRLDSGEAIGEGEEVLLSWIPETAMVLKA